MGGGKGGMLPLNMITGTTKLLSKGLNKVADTDKTTNQNMGELYSKAIADVEAVTGAAGVSGVIKKV